MPEDTRTAIGKQESMVDTAVQDVDTAAGDIGTAVSNVDTAHAQVETAHDQVDTALGDDEATARAQNDINTALGNDHNGIAARARQSTVDTARVQDSMVDTQFSDVHHFGGIHQREPKTSLALGASIKKVYSDLNDFISSPVADRLFTPIEQKSGVRHEHIVYGAVALLSLYLIFGSAAQLVSNIIGIAYPTYTSIQALRSKTKIDESQMRFKTTIDNSQIFYWVVFATLALVDFFAAKIPTYFLVKSVFLLFLSLPQINGAAFVYDNYVEATVVKVDNAIRNIMKPKGH